MLVLVLAMSLVVGISFICSLTEAALYAIPWSTIERLKRLGNSKGELLYQLRQEIDKPIAAILTLNTIANTAGSAVTGAVFVSVFNADYTVLFALGFTLLILLFGEIIPKTLGVSFCSSVMLFVAKPLIILIRILTPILIFLNFITKSLHKTNTPQVSEEDIYAIVGMSRKAGKIKEHEERIIGNILSLDQKRVYDIMTPRTVVFSLPANLSIDGAYANPHIWHFSRIPVYGENNEDLLGYVERRTLALRSREKQGSQILSEIMRPLHFVQENVALDVLLNDLLQSRVHLFAVVDEYGGLSGVVTLEDVLEEILGREIVDESDNIEDLRQFAIKRKRNIQ